MATTIHVPQELLERVDRRARARGVTRNRVILEAIEASLGSPGEWPPELLQMLATPLDARSSALLEQSLLRVRKHRVSRRRAPGL